MPQWWQDHGTALTILSLTLSVGGLAVIGLLIVMLPADYFVRPARPLMAGWLAAIHILLIVIKNLFGLIMVGLGLVMSIPLVPGPGLLTVLLGLSIMNFPGKKRFEASLLKIPRLLSGINTIRNRFGKPPLILPPEKSPAQPA